MTEAPATNKGRELSFFGNREDVRELADRLKIMLPGGMHYTSEEALTLAQISVAHDLDPFNGEVWLIKNEDNGKVYGALVGIKGHRKHAKRQADYWGEFVRVADPKVYNAPPEAIVYEYHIKDATTLKAWTAQMKVLFDMGFKLEECSKMIGPAPVTIGIGIYSPGDKTKMKPAQCAMFRAEKDALKRRFDVKFHIEINGQQMTAGVAQDEDQEAFLDEVEGEYTEVENDEPREPAEIMEEMGITSEEPPTEQTAPTKSTASVVDRLVADKKFQNVFEAANALKRCAIKNATDEQKYTWAVNYHAWRECESTPEQAAKLANEGRSPS